MRFLKLALPFVLLSIFGMRAWSRSSSLLEEVEKRYKAADTVKMEVSKTLKLKLLDREKKSEGVILIKKGGRLRWETEKPERSLVLADGHSIWLVDYPDEEGEKPTVIKATNPKKSQPHAVVAFLMGEGRLSDDFTVKREKKKKDDVVELDLKPKSLDDQIQRLTLFVDDKSKDIQGLSFEDEVGNVTELNFKNILFDSKIQNSKFKFTPPKDADVNVIE